MDMPPKQVLFAMIIQAVMMVFTLMLLVPPRAIADGKSPQWRAVVRTGGWVALCLTFCWSVVLGIVLALHRMTISI